MKSQLKAGAAISYLNIFLSSFFGFVTAPLMLKAFGDGEYGAYQIAVALVGYMSILDLGLHNVTTRFVAKYNAKKQMREQENFIAVNLILFGVIAGVVLIIGTILDVNVNNIFGASNSPQEIAIIRQLLRVLIINMAVSMPGAVFASVIVAYEHFVFKRIRNNQNSRKTCNGDSASLDGRKGVGNCDVGYDC